MLRWSGSSKEADIVECYFCTRKSRLQSHKGKAAVRDQLPIITGSPYHFCCPYCESWNIKNTKTGEYVDNPQAIHNVASPPVTALRQRQASNLQESPFCHNCITNQQLQIQLLAGFVPYDTTTQEETELFNRLPAYKVSLDSRYPLVCPHCQGRIEEIIKERNWKAKARTVGGWLKNSARLAKNTALSDYAAQDGVADVAPRLWLWRIKGTCWKLLYASTALAAAMNAYTPVLPLASHTTLSSLPYWLRRLPWRVMFTCGTFLFSFWDPSYKDRVLRGGRVAVRGRRRWIALQAVAFLSRLFWVLELNLVNTSYNAYTPYLVSFIHLTILLGRHKVIQVRGPKRVKLVERSLQSRSAKASPSTTPVREQATRKARQAPPQIGKNQRAPSSTSPAFGQVSMGSTPPVTRMYKRHAFTAEDEEDDMDEDEEVTDPADGDMDWQPFENSHAASSNNFNDVDMIGTDASSPTEIKLRPAVFNPNDEWGLTAYGMKGLDSLFAKGVSLEDIRLDVAEQTTMNTLLPYAIYGVMGTSAVYAAYTMYNMLPSLSIRW